MTYITNKDYFVEVSAGRVARASAVILNVRALTRSKAPGVPPGGVDEQDSLNDLFPTIAESLIFTSDNVNDTVAGSGARTIRVNGLDTDYNPQSETIATNGTTPVTTTLLYRRFRKATVVTAGNEGWNLGNISVIGNTSGFNYGALESFDSVTQSGVYTVPAGQQARILALRLNVARDRAGSTSLVDIVAYARVNIPNAAWVNVFESRLDSAVAVEVDLQGVIGSIFPEKTDLVLAYLSDGDNVLVRIRAAVMEEDNA